ncbi:MAG: hypothetical protein KC425_01415 [Anaerolineales bacterium]|nr:hypothetical protein [Anaerolineales bacterium]
MMRELKPRLASLVGVLMVLLSATAVFGSQTYLSDEWSVPQRIPGYDNDANPPVLLVDPTGVIHAFGDKAANRGSVIIYSRWSLAEGWSAPVDIILPTYKEQARLMDAVLDDAGMVHLIFFSGDDLDANLYYTSAPLPQLGSAPAWTAPLLIGPAAITPSEARLVLDHAGYLAVVYAGRAEGRGVYVAYSTDNGQSWAEPQVFFLTYSDALFLWAFQALLVDDKVHVAWTVNNISGNGEVIYYVRLSRDGTLDREPVELAVVDGYEADWPSLVAYADQLIVVYNNSQPATRWMRRSPDGGETWTEPVRPFPHIGEYGFASFVVDSGGTLRLFTGNRIGNPATHGMWQSIWQGDGWSELQPLVSGPPGNGFDPSKPRAVISQGNLLFVAWRTDPMAGPNGIWYAYTLLDTPRVAGEMPVFAAEEDTVGETAVAATPAPVDSPPTLPAVLSADQDPLANAPTGPAYALTLGAVPAIVLVALALIIYRVRLPRQR